MINGIIQPHNKAKMQSLLPHNWSSNKQWINDNRTTTLERAVAIATGRGLGAFCWRQIFALDSVVVETQNYKLAWMFAN